MEADGPWRVEICRCQWGYEARFVSGGMETVTRPWRPSRRWIERVARRRLRVLNRTNEKYWLEG